MKIKSASSFRKWYKELIPARKKNPELWNENFIGTLHKDESGFLQMYHGGKDDIYGFLRKEVEMAEDGQAIYEFVQNAADSDSSNFYMFYDEKHLIVINNGEVFSKEGIKSILDIGQSFGKQKQDKIGRYGIGFKLVHRLVGKSSGLDELLNIDKKGYRGPILFSWSDKSQFENFINSNKYEYVDIIEEDAPWLLKILLTNFPAQPEEIVKDIDFNEIEPFKIEELNKFKSFLNICIDKINLDLLNTGTIFFIQLGEEKFEYLERQKEEYLNGLSTSMHFLKSLDTLVINENVVEKDREATNILEFTIKNGSETFNAIGLSEIRDKESDANFKICFADNANSANEIKKHPNIYKYFPAVKEVNSLSFVIHCNLFELSSNRQNLTETPINRNLLLLLLNQVKVKMEEAKFENRNLFKSLFTSVIMSDESSSSSSGNSWQNIFFYDNLLSFIRTTIPTKNNKYSDNHQNVKINKLKLELNLSDFGLNEIQWFEWENETDKLVIERAKSKLGIDIWDIRDIVENANLESINNWIEENCEQEIYEAFLKELEGSDLRLKTKARICQIKFFKFTDGRFISFNRIFYNPKIYKLSLVLENLGFAMPVFDISKFENICSAATIESDKKIYQFIAEKCKQNKLSVADKKKLFLSLEDFDNVGQAGLKDLNLFCNSYSVIKPLKGLIGDIETPSWLYAYKLKQDEYFAELKPYLIQNEQLFDKIILPNIDIIKDELTEVEEIKELVNFYKENFRSFFNEYIIQKQSNGYKIIDKLSKVQVVPHDKKSREFIESFLSNDLIVLPFDFSDFNKEDGIIKGSELYAQIIDLVNVDEHKEILVDIIEHKARHKFLQELSEFRFNSEKVYTKEDYEFKILDMACSDNVLNEIDCQKFRDNVVIETVEQDLALSEIPSSVDAVVIDNKDLSLSQILPSKVKHGKVLSDMLQQFISLSVQKERLYELFGIQSENDPKQVFDILNQDYEVLENADQLAFVLLCSKEFDVNIENFKVETFNEKEWKLKYNYYTQTFSFIGEDYLLKPIYSDVSKIIDLPVTIGNSDNQILQHPFIIENKFVCPHIKSPLSDEEKYDFVNYIFNEWLKDQKQFKKNIDWSEIEETKTQSILDFNPTNSFFLVEYACENEKLPDYLIKWIGQDDDKISFMSHLGVWTENSVIVEFRKYLSGKISDFNNSHLAQEIRFIEDEFNLFNSFIWLKDNEITLKTAEQFETFEKVVNVINKNRTTKGDLKIKKEFDFEELEAKAAEWEESYYVNWKKNSDVAIFLYEGELPKTISLAEIADYVFYSFYEGNAAVDDKNNIYINQYADVKKELRKLELDDDSDFNFDELWQNKLEKLEKENAQLRKSSEATLGSELSTDISKNDQKEVNREAKEIVKEKLESEGFEFTEGIGNFSTINGVYKDDIEFPLVVKSYKYQDEPLQIGANEWIQLMKPNSMFWLHYGNRKLGCLKLYDLLRSQDKLTISFSTENLDVGDRLDKFAELLHYFGNVHFDFNGVKPSDYSRAKDLGDYRFDERSYEEDLSGDDEDIL